jgi:hypothetical protein
MPCTSPATVHKNYGLPARIPNPPAFARSEQIGHPAHRLICFYTVLQGWSLVPFVFMRERLMSMLLCSFFGNRIACGYEQNLTVFVNIHGENLKKERG